MLSLFDIFAMLRATATDRPLARLGVLTNVILAATLAAQLSGCGSNTADANAQVVATVNDTKISAAQVDQALHDGPAEAAATEASQRALTSVIDEELLVQGALQSELQNDPDVARELERARRRILANAYAERRIYPQGTPTAEAVAAYYKEHPALFSDRRTYQIVAFTVDRADVPDALHRELQRTHGATDVRRILEARRIKFETEVLRKTAEQLPLDQLPAFASANPGDVLIVPQANGRETLLTVTSIERAPISFERARPLIEQYLTSTRNRAALEAYLKDAKANAKITMSESRTSDQPLLASNAARSRNP